MADSKIFFRLRKIHEDQFSFDRISFSEIENFDDENLNLSFTLDFGNDIEQNAFSVFISVSYQYKTKQESIEFLKFSFETEYEIKDMKNVVSVTGKDWVEIPDNILLSLINVAIGSGRGIIHSKTSGVPGINDLYLPIIDSQKMLDFYKAKKQNTGSESQDKSSE